MPKEIQKDKSKQKLENSRDSELAKLSQRIEKVLELYPSRALAAKACGKSEDSLWAWTKGKYDPSFTAVALLAVGVGVRIDWLATGQGPMMMEGPDPTVEDRHQTKIPILELAVSAGPGEPVFADKSAGGWMGMPTDLVRNSMNMTPGAVVVLRVRGDSMSPTMDEGDMVFLDTSVKAIDQPGIYVLRRGDDLFVKRVHKHMDGTTTLKADNPRYPEDQLTPEALGELSILGRVGRVLGKGA